MSLFYVDTSAVVKLLREESDSAAFADFYDRNSAAEWVSSALLRIELARVVARTMPEIIHEARELLRAFACVAIDDAVVEAAMDEPDPRLRSLDAIHLATARGLAADLTGLVTYDDRLGAAAAAAGIEVVCPQGAG